MFSVILFIYADNTSLYFKCDQASFMWQKLELASELGSGLQDTVKRGRKWLVDFNAWKTQLVSLDWCNNIDAIDVKMGESVIKEKLSFKMLGLTFSSKLDWNSHIIFIAKITSKKTWSLIRSTKILSPEVALYLNKSTIRSWMEYCCHIWSGTPSCYFELLDELQRRICRTVDRRSLTFYLCWTLAHHRIVAS